MDDVSRSRILEAAREFYHVGQAQRLVDVEQFLVERFGAEGLPLESMDDYENDQHVDARHLHSLHTITDPATLASISTVEERENLVAGDDESAFDDFASRLNEEHGSLLRVSVLLESSPDDPELIGNFRVYGGGQVLRETLWALTGILPRDLGPANGELYLRAIAGSSDVTA